MQVCLYYSQDKKLQKNHIKVVVMNLETKIQNLIPKDTHIQIATEQMWNHTLLEQEENYIIEAAPKRKAEFRAGRNAARQALKNIGADFEFPILRSDFRAPIWPENISGSISHTDTLCLCILAHQQNYHHIGIDIEKNQALPKSTRNLILNESEIEIAKQFRKHQDQDINIKLHEDTLIFCMKESLYKIIQPATGIMLDFMDAELIELNQNEALIKIRIDPFNPDHEPLVHNDLFKQPIKVIYTYTNDHIFTGIFLTDESQNNDQNIALCMNA